MTNKVYRTAQGKMVDMGSLTLQNEMIRAVGNMNVNARGDRVDGANQVIDQKNRQVQRRIQRQSNVVNSPVHSSTVTAKQSQIEQPIVEVEETEVELELETITAAIEETIIPATPAPVDITIDQAAIPAGGLAAALAKAKTVKQTLDPTAKQKAQAQGVRKL